MDVDSTAQPTTYGSYIRVGLLLLIGTSGLIKYLLDRRLPERDLPMETKLLGLYCVYALISTIYSIDPYFTILRASSLAAFFCFLLGLHVWLTDAKKLERMFMVIFYLFAVVMVLNLVALIIFGDIVWLYGSRFRGLWGHPNSMGIFAMISYPILLWKYSRSDFFGKWGCIILLMITVFLHLLTGSRSSIIASLIGVSVWYIVLRQKGRLVSILAMLVMFGAFAFFETSLRNVFQRETDSGKSITTLTGRTKFWRACATLISERPILGYGYGVGGKVWSDPRFNDPKLALWSGNARASLHNGYLSKAVETGTIGFILMLYLYVFPLWRCRILPPTYDKALVFAIISMGLVTNLVESTLGSASILGIIFWLTWIVASRMCQGTFDLASNKHPDR